LALYRIPCFYHLFHIVVPIPFFLFVDKKLAQELSSGSIKRLALHQLIFTAMIIAAIIALKIFYPAIIYIRIWWIVLFFIILTLASMAIMARAAKNAQKNFMSIYLSAMVARLFVSIIFAALFILLDKAHVMTFAGNFVVLYLLYLGFEIYGILTNLRHQFTTGSDKEHS
jgi:hypothetical protein